MTRLTIEQIRAPRLRRDQVEVKSLGGAVLIRELTGAERDDFERYAMAHRDGYGVRRRLAAMSLCDEAGALIFEDVEEGVGVLSGWPGAAVDDVFLAARKLSGLDAEAVDDAEGE